MLSDVKCYTVSDSLPFNRTALAIAAFEHQHHGGDSREASAHWLTLEFSAGLLLGAFVPKVPDVYALLRSLMCIRSRNLLLVRADEFTESPFL